MKKENVNLKIKAFTLVELVITIAIVIILSVISVPIYRGYVDKAKYSEGYALLGTVLSAQKAYYNEYGNFYQDPYDWKYTANHDVLGIDVRGNKYFTCFFVWSSNRVPYYFHVFSMKPEELHTNIGHEFDTTNLILQYNMTKGTCINAWKSAWYN